MIVYIYNIGVDLYNGFNGLRHRINWTYFTVLDGLAHPLYSIGSVIGALIESFIESFERVSKWKLSVDLNSGLTSDTLNIPTGLVIVISITFAKKYATI